jgi:uncharacterized membrane protein YqaE (UPF0057 family)
MGKGEATGRTDAPTFCEIFLAIILPPIGVFLKYGCSVRPHNQQLFCFVFLFRRCVFFNFFCFFLSFIVACSFSSSTFFFCSRACYADSTCPWLIVSLWVRKKEGNDTFLVLCLAFFQTFHSPQCTEVKTAKSHRNRTIMDKLLTDFFVFCLPIFCK